MVIYILISLWYFGMILFLREYHEKWSDLATLLWAVALTICQLNLEFNKEILQISIIC